LELQQADCAPFAAAVQAGVGSVMPAHVAYPAWDSTGSAATFSKPILSYLRDTIRFEGLVVTDAFIMAGATAAAPEGAAAAAAVTAGCDMLLYPTDWAGVVRALEQVPADRAGQALERHEKAVTSWGTPSPGAASRGQPSALDEGQLAEHQKFADSLADRAVHLLRGNAPSLTRSLDVAIVDDDVGGPYSIPPRDVFHKTLRDSGFRVGPGRGPGGRHSILLVYAEPRSWKGRADLGAGSLARLERLVPDAALVILCAHPRLVGQIPGDVPVLCAWHGQPLMQRAAARWVVSRSA
jgi:beta-glucosidase-like glycosyl hydrolase